MKKISLAQPGMQVGPKEENGFHLPYSVGRLWSFSKTREKIKNNIKLDTLAFKRENINIAAKRLSRSDVLALSFYVWNDKYNKALAAKIKDLNPNCIIIAGGPELPVTDINVFYEYPFLDFIVKKEGEVTFVNLIEELIDNNFDKDASFKSLGLLINRNGIVENTGMANRITDLNVLVSPYLDGTFDKLVEDNPEVNWSCILETNRGCPYQCTYCDWGSLTYSKIKKFDLDLVLQEIEWIAQHNGYVIDIADANFGIFYERDNTIADKILECREKYGFPKITSTSWAKNQKNELLIHLIKKISATGMVISTQTLNENALEIIKRKNTNQHVIGHIFEEAEKQGIAAETEMILGLPGETKETWKQNFYKLFDLNNHTGVTVYILQALRNAPLTLEQMDEYEIKTSPNYTTMMRPDVSEDNDILESIDLVVSTKDMPWKDMLEAMVFTWFIMLFHRNGYSNYLTRVLNKKYNISYENFYEQFFEWLPNNNEWFNKKRSEYLKHAEDFLKNGKLDMMNIDGCDVNVNTSVIFLLGSYHVFEDNKHDELFKSISKFTKETFNQIDEDLVDEIISFTSSGIVRYDDISNFPKSVSFKYDILNYLLNDQELYKEATYKYYLEDKLYKDISRQTFYDYLYYRRKEVFGKATITEDTGVA